MSLESRIVGLLKAGKNITHAARLSKAAKTTVSRYAKLHKIKVKMGRPRLSGAVKPVRHYVKRKAASYPPPVLNGLRGEIQAALRVMVQKELREVLKSL